MQTSRSPCEVFEVHVQARAAQEGLAPRESCPKKHSSSLTPVDRCPPRQSSPSSPRCLPQAPASSISDFFLFHKCFQADVRPVDWILWNLPFRERVPAPQITLRVVLTWVGNSAGVHLRTFPTFYLRARSQANGLKVRKVAVEATIIRVWQTTKLDSMLG